MPKSRQKIWDGRRRFAPDRGEIRRTLLGFAIFLDRVRGDSRERHGESRVRRGEVRRTEVLRRHRRHPSDARRRVGARGAQSEHLAALEAPQGSRRDGVRPAFPKASIRAEGVRGRQYDVGGPRALPGVRQRARYDEGQTVPQGARTGHRG